VILDAAAPVLGDDLRLIGTKYRGGAAASVPEA
jgi:hypothetical protein